MRDIHVIWNEYLIGNEITDEELTTLLKHVKDIVTNLMVFKDKRYQLMLNDLLFEQGRLEQYKSSREETILEQYERLYAKGKLKKKIEYGSI